MTTKTTTKKTETAAPKALKDAAARRLPLPLPDAALGRQGRQKPV